MQTLNLSGLEALNKFLLRPTHSTANLLQCCPVLFRMVEHEFCAHGKYSSETLGVCAWMYQRALEVLKSLWTMNTKPLNEACVSENTERGEVWDWEEVS